MLDTPCCLRVGSSSAVQDHAVDSFRRRKLSSPRPGQLLESWPPIKGTNQHPSRLPPPHSTIPHDHTRPLLLSPLVRRESYFPLDPDKTVPAGEAAVVPVRPNHRPIDRECVVVDDLPRKSFVAVAGEGGRPSSWAVEAAIGRDNCLEGVAAAGLGTVRSRRET